MEITNEEVVTRLLEAIQKMPYEKQVLAMQLFEDEDWAELVRAAKRKSILMLNGEFTWMFNQNFFIETARGNFIWKDPDYGGDNSITPTKMTYAEYCEHSGIDYGRDKGSHIIGEYVGWD